MLYILLFVAITALVGAIAGRWRLARTAEGPKLLSLECPITVGPTVVFNDGCVGATLAGVDGGRFAFSLDDRPDAGTPRAIYVGALHPSADGATVLVEGCAYEQELRRVIDAAVGGETEGIATIIEARPHQAPAMTCSYCQHIIVIGREAPPTEVTCRNCGVRNRVPEDWRPESSTDVSSGETEDADVSGMSCRAHYGSDMVAPLGRVLEVLRGRVKAEAVLS